MINQNVYFDRYGIALIELKEYEQLQSELEELRSIADLLRKFAECVYDDWGNCKCDACVTFKRFDEYRKKYL